MTDDEADKILCSAGVDADAELRRAMKLVDEAERKTPLTAAEILAVLCEIDAGSMTVEPEGEVPYCGNHWFKTATAWRFLVFIDCDEWDYIDTVEAPDGREVHLWGFLHDPRWASASRLPLDDPSRAAAMDACEAEDGMGAIREYSPLVEANWGSL